MFRLNSGDAVSKDSLDNETQSHPFASLPAVFEPFQLPFVQRGLIDILVLAVGAGVLGTWIVLRGLAFFSHAVGTAAFPGLVLAAGVGFSPALGAFGMAIAFTGALWGLARRRGTAYDSLTALVLVGCLAAGVILASDVYHSGSNVEQLLFGSVLLVDQADIRLAAVATVAVLISTALLGRRWLATGFDEGGDSILAGSTHWFDGILLALIALTTTAALTEIGALLVAAIFVAPAATVRLFANRMLSWQIGSALLAAAEGTVGLWLSVKTNAPPGATIATLSGVVFALAAIARALDPGRRMVGVATAAAVAVFAVSGCAASGSDSGKLSVVATTTQIGDFAREVGGNKVDVAQILAPNTDPHDYEPRPDDVTRTADAKLVFENGDNLDAWMSKVISDSGSDATVVDLGAGVPVKRPGESSGPEASQYDPHWWHDPRNAEAAVNEIAAKLSQADPKDRASFEANARRYVDRAEAAGRRNRELHEHSSGGGAKAGHRSRRLRLLRRPLRNHGGGRGDPVADDAGPALGQGPRRPGRPDPQGGRQGDLPGELAEPEAGRADRLRDRRYRQPHPLRRHARAARAQAATPTSTWSRPMRTRWSRASALAGGAVR